jgi:predicted nucleic acid-binding Zn ribbon protein
VRVFNDYQCDECLTIDEHFLENGCNQTTCLVCGATARRILRPLSFRFKGHDFPTNDDQWVKKREQKMALERKRNPESY